MARKNRGAVPQRSKTAEERAVAADLFLMDRYYPVPLANLKGVSLDIHFATSAHGWITQARPWWSLLIWLVGMALLGHCVFERELHGDWQDMNLLYAAAATSVIGPLIFLFLKVYTRTDFSPKMEQGKRVALSRLNVRGLANPNSIANREGDHARLQGPHHTAAPAVPTDARGRVLPGGCEELSVHHAGVVR